MGLLDKIKGDDEQEEVELRPGNGSGRLKNEVKDTIADGPSSSNEEDEVEMSSSGGFLPGMGSDASADTGSSSSNKDMAEKLDRLIAQNKKIISLLEKDSDAGNDSMW